MKHPARIRKTEEQIDATIKNARAGRSKATRIDEARYDATTDSVIITLAIPRAAIAGFKTIDPGQLADLAAQKSGYSIWSEAADTGLRLERLLQVAAGPAMTAVAAGILGQKRTPAKAMSARENGRKGGRPSKKRDTSPPPKKKMTPTSA